MRCDGAGLAEPALHADHLYRVHGLPCGVGMPRAFSSAAMARAHMLASSAKTGRSASALALASSRSWMPALRPPSFTPCAFLAARASLVRWEISRRSFSASAA